MLHFQGEPSFGSDFVLTSFKSAALTIATPKQLEHCIQIILNAINVLQGNVDSIKVIELENQAQSFKETNCELHNQIAMLWGDQERAIHKGYLI